MNEVCRQHYVERIRERNKGKRQKEMEVGVEREHKRDEDNKQSIKRGLQYEWDSERKKV